ncbi:AN1-type zinc finger protein 4-like [Styela clava]
MDGGLTLLHIKGCKIWNASVKYCLMDYGNRIPFHATMNLFIETLTGTCFELRVSPFETILSVKAKIQRLEGIPISQQHLIWEGTELDDDFCLHDYRIKDSCMLKLVLAMRGGPINTRRIAMDEPSILDMADYIDANQEELLEELSVSPSTGRGENNSQVTLLVYRNGDQINFFRVVDRGDGALSPVSESYSGTSYSEIDDVAEMTSKQTRTLSRLIENRITASKMKHLQNRMHDLQVKDNSSVMKMASTSTTSKIEKVGNPLPKLDRIKRNKLDQIKTSSAIEQEVIYDSEEEKFPEPSDDSDRKSPRTERLLKVLNGQKSNSTTSQQKTSVAPPLKSASSRFSHTMTSKMAFNRHDMYLRSYGLLPPQPPQDEMVENPITESRTTAGLTTSSITSNGATGITKTEGKILQPNPPYTANTSTHSWCRRFKTPTRGNKYHSHHTSLINSELKPLAPTVKNNSTATSETIVQASQATRRELALPPVPQLPPLTTSNVCRSARTDRIRDPALVSKTDLYTKLISGESALKTTSDHKDIKDTVPLPLPLGYTGIVNATKTKDMKRQDFNEKPTVLSKVMPLGVTVSETPLIKPDHNFLFGPNDDHDHMTNGRAKHSTSNPSIPAGLKNKRVDFDGDVTSLDVDCLRALSCYSRKSPHSPNSILPPVRPLVIKKKKCVWCGKKTGLATSYTCRCGKNFCATHRYAETHDCTFDYKSSGRQLLKENNPIVTAPKLPKI